MSIAKLSGADIYYEIHGDGAPLVLVHGGSGSHLSWWQQVPYFRHDHSCLVYDQRGFGRSTGQEVTDREDGRCYLDDLRELLDFVGFTGTPVRLLGTSFGTMPVLGYAADHPERVAACVLSGGIGGITTETTAAGWQARSRVIDHDPPADPTDSIVVRSPEEVQVFRALYAPEGSLQEGLAADDPALAFLFAELTAYSDGPPIRRLKHWFRHGRPVTAAEAASVAVPVLFVAGARGRAFPPTEMRAAAALFPQGEVAVIPDAGQLAYFEKADAFNAVVGAFLERHRPNRGGTT